MQITGNTLLITGGSSGIGRGLAEAFHLLGNQVIVCGRRQTLLETVTAANPGMKSALLDVQDIAALPAFAASITRQFPSLNVLINNAGIMRMENLNEPEAGFAEAEAIIRTNFTAPLRLTTALLPQLKSQPRAVVMNVSSGLAFVPMAATPTYCATKAAIHSWTESLRAQLRGSQVEILELIPPYVATELMGRHDPPDPRAMPLADYIAEVMKILHVRSDEREIRVARVLPLRFAERQGKYEEWFHMLNPAAAAEA